MSVFKHTGMTCAWYVVEFLLHSANKRQPGTRPIWQTKGEDMHVLASSGAFLFALLTGLTQYHLPIMCRCSPLRFPHSLASRLLKLSIHLHLILVSRCL